MSLDWTPSESPIPTDVDECSSGASCGPHGHCINTEGSFRCSCAPGYRAPAGRPGPCAGEQEGRGGQGGVGVGEPGSGVWVLRESLLG